MKFETDTRSAVHSIYLMYVLIVPQCMCCAVLVIGCHVVSALWVAIPCCRLCTHCPAATVITGALLACVRLHGLLAGCHTINLLCPSDHSLMEPHANCTPCAIMVVYIHVQDVLQTALLYPEVSAAQHQLRGTKLHTFSSVSSCTECSLLRHVKEQHPAHMPMATLGSWACIPTVLLPAPLCRALCHHTVIA